MVDGRKKAVSLRLATADIRRIKRIAQRLGVRDSDVIRYAIRLLMGRLSSLTDPETRGRALVPLFLEGGAELVRHFQLDAARLGGILNEGIAAGEAVPDEDAHLLVMLAAGDAGEGSEGAPPGGERRADPSRRYLYEKYLFRADAR